MTFNVGGPPGQAVLAPCAETIDGIKGLRAQAEELWKAEAPGASGGTIGASWGCVGVLFRQDRAGADLVPEWDEYFRGRKLSAVWPVDQQGMLHIPWPARVSDDTPVDVDLILATATEPEVMAPTTEDIADAWADQDKGHERYFFQNVDHGIRTPEDGLIWKRIEERAPRWLSNEVYAKAIAALGEEAKRHVF